MRLYIMNNIHLADVSNVLEVSMKAPLVSVERMTCVHPNYHRYGQGETPPWSLRHGGFTNKSVSLFRDGITIPFFKCTIFRPAIQN